MQWLYPIGIKVVSPLAIIIAWTSLISVQLNCSAMLFCDGK